MASKKEVDLFPHSGFPYRLVDPNDKKKVAWFQCEEHLHKHISRYNITDPKVDVAEGHSYTPPKVKKPRKRRTTTTKKPKMSEVKDFHKKKKK